MDIRCSLDREVGAGRHSLDILPAMTIEVAFAIGVP